MLPADVDHPGPGVEEGEEELAGPLVGPVVGGQGDPGLTSIQCTVQVYSALWEIRPNWGFIKEAEKIGASENKESGQLCSQ